MKAQNWKVIFILNMPSNVLCISDQKCGITGYSQNMPVIGILAPTLPPPLLIFSCNVCFLLWGKKKI